MMHHINPKTAFFLHRTDLISNNFLIVSAWSMGVSFPNFVKVVERGKDGFEEAAPYAVALYLPGNILTLRVVV